MKIIILSILSFFCTLSTWAEGEINALVLHLATGKNVTCMLDEQPVVTFGGDDLVIKTHMSSMTYLSADVNKFTYTYVDPSVVNNVNIDATLFSLEGNVLNAKSLAPNSTVTIFTVDGKKVAETKTNAQGSVTVPLPSQASATYIINTSVANFKITMP